MEEKRRLEAGQAVHRFRVEESLANPNLTLYGGNFIGLMYNAAHEAARVYAGTEVVNVNIGDVSIERPISVGEVAFACARVSFVSRTSMETEVFVVMDDEHLTPVVRGAHFTFVAIGKDGKKAQVPAPIIAREEQQAFQDGDSRRVRLISERESRKEAKPISISPWASKSLLFEPPQGKARDIRSGFAITQNIVMPSDANGDGTILGGVLAGWMDSTAAIACSHYALQPSVTVSIHGIHFDKRLRVGETAIVAAQVAHVGSSSMVVTVDVDRRRFGDWSPVARDAFFTFIGVDSKKKTPVPVPPAISPSEFEDMRERAKEAQAYLKQYRAKNTFKQIPLERGRGNLPIFILR